MKCKLSIQEKLKDLRIERNLRLEELAEATGLSRSALGSYETNEDIHIIKFIQVYINNIEQNN